MRSNWLAVTARRNRGKNLGKDGADRGWDDQRPTRPWRHFDASARLFLGKVRPRSAASASPSNRDPATACGATQIASAQDVSDSSPIAGSIGTEPQAARRRLTVGDDFLLAVPTVICVA